MSDTDATTAVLDQATPAVDAEQPLTLDEFCRRVSTTDRRVELIGGFHFTEKAAGRVKDTESAFAKRFADFADKPVL